MEDKQYGESKFWKFINLAGNAIALNFVFLLCCLPVVTLGPALCGLYSGVRFLIRGDGWFAGFKEGFCKKFLRCMLAGVLSTLVVGYLLLNFNVGYNFYLEQGDMAPMIVYAIGMIPPLLIAAALWPTNVYFNYTGNDWLQNAFTMLKKAPWQVAVTAAVLFAPIILVLYFAELVYLGAIIFIGFYYSVAAFISTILLKDELLRQLLKYREEHPNEGEGETYQ